MTEKRMRFTVIDAIIILVVIAAAAVLAVKVMPSMLSNTEKEKVSFTVLIQRQDESFAEAVTVGDNVTISLTEKDGGVVKAVASEPAKTLAYNSIDGTYANKEIEGKYDVYVTIEAEMEVSELAMKAGGTAVKVGADIPVRGKGYASNGYVIEIDG